VGDDNSRSAIQRCRYIGCDLGCWQQLPESADPSLVSRRTQVTDENVLVSSVLSAVSNLCFCHSSGGNAVIVGTVLFSTLLCLYVKAIKLHDCIRYRPLE